ncbi:MAG: hypothetical protein SGJ19_26675 [Planctomycetia bacterium]|nr:hypothetical protein [Planctomycetia bacterium]
MAKKKSRIKEVVETVESWVGIGPKAKKNSKGKSDTKSSKTKTGPIRELAQEVLPGAKERQTKRKNRRVKVATAVKKAVKKVKNATRKKP